MAASFTAWLEFIAQLATILTAFLAVFAYGKYLLERRVKRQRVEDNPRAQKVSGKDKGQRSLLHLAAKLRMTGQDLMDTAFRSPYIATRVTESCQGFADRTRLEFNLERKAN